MDVILHAGAHRTGTTSFQNYLRAHQPALEAVQVGFWGPWRTPEGLLSDLVQPPSGLKAAVRARGRLQLKLAASARRNLSHLVVTDENMLGTPRRSLRCGTLYHDAGARMARLAHAFGQPRCVVLQIRALDSWWGSVMAHLVPRGESVLDPDHIRAIARQPRGWRQVITDLACACPGAAILVTPYEALGDRPDALLRAMTGKRCLPAVRAGEFWLNRRPELPELRRTLLDRDENPDRLPQGDRRWQPFTPAEVSALRESYSDDLFWLRAGADGLATLWQETQSARPGWNLAAGLQERGRHNDGSARRLAPNG